MNNPVHCFNSAYKGISRVLSNEVFIAPAYVPKTEKPSEKKKYKAIWDTGATMTAISTKIVSECQLKQIDIVKCGTAAGVVENCPVYLISLFLPNGVAFPQLRASEAKLSGADVLIGMDIINTGDFFITNFNGKTVFNFRMPSLCEVDFTKNPRFGHEQFTVNSGLPGRNDPCPCGSGKK
jgi:hypothetical protein